MSTKCDCNDPECVICSARPSTGRTAFVDPYLEAKARAAAQSAPQVPVAPTVQVPTPVVAQLAAAWTPPTVDPVPEAPAVAPLTPEQLAAREAALTEALGVNNAPQRTRKAQTAYAKAYSAWQAECVQRKEWIDNLYENLLKRQRARAEAILGWDAHVLEAKVAWQHGKATLPPSPPLKAQFQG